MIKRPLQMNAFLFIMAIVLTTCETETTESTGERFADVVKVSTRISGELVTFSVSIKSPDTGCEQFADWWEVIDLEGNLLERRILLHSHIQEQPFTRSGKSIEINKNEVVVVRAHMNNTGYGGQVMKGSINTGFEASEFTLEFDERLASTEPLPTGCAN